LIISPVSVYHADVEAGVANWLIGYSDTRYNAHTLHGGERNKRQEFLWVHPQFEGEY